MSQFFESIKIEFGLVHLHKFHQQRVDATFLAFGRQPSLNLRQIFQKIPMHADGLFKLRISYDLEGNYSFQILPYKAREIRYFQLVEADGLEYPFKSEDRAALEALKTSAETEIIIVRNGEITDTSFSNLIFCHEKRWYTPKSYLLNGVQRQFLLKSMAIKERRICIDDLKDFSHFQIINALNGLYDNEPYAIESIINLP